jgi:3-phosphoglycerate kinase
MRAMPTLLHLTHAGAKVILITHVGREASITLDPLFNVLQEHLQISYVPQVIGKKAETAVKNLKDGEVLLLENMRSHKGETSNDAAFGKKLAAYGDIYVNDAFSVSHREHASIVGIPKYIKGYFGLTFKEEYFQLMKVVDPIAPSLFILGGAKFETKQPLVEKYIKKYNQVFVGGALANDFFKAKGYEVGKSLVSDSDLKNSKLLDAKNLILPIDVTVQAEKSIRVTTPDMVEKNEVILDAGPATIEFLSEYIADAHTILWNGPLGNYERGFSEYTKACAVRIADSKAYSVVGGGDTIAAIENLSLNDKFSFLSTAGGAMLTFLEEGTLPGIKAIVTQKE